MSKNRQIQASYSLPFYHLSTEEKPFWHLRARTGKEKELKEIYKIGELADSVRFSLGKLNKIIIGAELDQELYLLMSNKESLAILRDCVIKTYFDESVHTLLYKQSEINNTAYRQRQKHIEIDLPNSKNQFRDSNFFRNMPLRELLNINTQVRRLAYIPALLNIAAQHNFNYDTLATRLEMKGKNYESSLQNHLSSSGSVIPKFKSRKLRRPDERASHAAKRYVDFAQNIGWINQISGMYTITRLGRVLLTVNEAVQKNVGSNENLFNLSEAQRLFFIKELWSKDGDILYTIINLLTPYPKSLKSIQERYGDEYLRHLQKRVQQNDIDRDRRKIYERIANIKTWTNSDRYAEQFVSTRLNWMVDLGLINIDNKGGRNFSLSENGFEFKSLLPDINSLSNEWINESFFKTVAHCFIEKKSELANWEIDLGSREQLIKWLRIAFKALRRESIPKFPLTSVSLFICIAMTSGSLIKMDHKDFIDIMLSRVQINKDIVAEIRLSGRENEAYLILNPV